jgi:Holliday junction resolvasome RuvABC endonuclease subunit
MSTERVLALDLGTKCGWAINYAGGTPVYGTLDLTAGRFSGGGMRFVRFRRELDRLLEDTDRVTFEEVRRHMGVDAAHVYGGMLAILTAECEERKIPYEGVPVGTIKKHATGKGNAGKAEVIAAMRAKGYAPKDDNQADALALWHLTTSPD